MSDMPSCLHEKTSIIVIKVKGDRNTPTLVRHEVCRKCETVIRPIN